MLATSVAVHEPSATSSSSTGEGADERCEFVSRTSARPAGVVPTKRSSATNLTTALPPVDIDRLRRKNNTANTRRVSCYDSRAATTSALPHEEKIDSKVTSHIVHCPGDAFGE